MIECANEVLKDELFEVKVTIVKEVSHPNTTEHHIRWIQLYFHADGDKFPYQVVNFEFTAHGEAVDGADKGPVNPSLGHGDHEDKKAGNTVSGFPM